MNQDEITETSAPVDAETLASETDEKTMPFLRDRRWRILLPLWLAMLYAFSVGAFSSFLIRALQNLVDGWLPSMIAAACLFTPVVVSIAFAISIPMLLFRSILNRIVSGVSAPALIWISLFAGIPVASLLQSVPYRTDPLQEFLQATSILLIGLVSGFLVVGWASWFLRWRVDFEDSPLTQSRFGIQDLIAVTTFVAAFFAFEINFSPFAPNFSMLLLGLGFYGAIGALSFSLALFAIRMLLGPERQSPWRRNWIGIVGSLVAINCIWFVPMSTSGIPTAFNPILAAIIAGASTWIVAACTAVLICIGLRRYGLQIRTPKLDRLERLAQNSAR